jgi:hypothetical protein
MAYAAVLDIFIQGSEETASSFGIFEAIVYDLRVVLRLAEGREGQPSAAICDRRTLQSTPESGPRAGYDGAKRPRGSKV